jgi:hypothetical protein
MWISELLGRDLLQKPKGREPLRASSTGCIGVEKKPMRIDASFFGTVQRDHERVEKERKKRERKRVLTRNRKKRMKCRREKEDLGGG